MNLELFTTGPSCQRCAVVKMHLERRGLEYVETRVDKDRPKAVELRQQGFNQSPVLKVERDGEVEWAEGYRPDFIDSLAS